MIKLSDVKVRPQYRTWVRHRLVVLEYAWAHGPAAAGRHYRISARTIRRWRKRWRAAGVEGLVPSYLRHRPRRVPPTALEQIRHARQELGYGAARTRLWLQRVHGVRLAMGTLQRVFRDVGLPRLRRTRKREPRQMKLFKKAGTGRSIQVDVKYVQIAGRWAFQYTALDDCTRFRVLRLYRRLHHGSSLAFLGSSNEPSPSPSSGCSVTTARNSHSPLCWGSKPPGSATDTIAPGGRSRTAKSSGAIGSIRRSLGPAALSRFRGGRGRPSGLGGPVQLRTVLPGAPGPHPSRETCRPSAAAAGRLVSSCLRVIHPKNRGSILTRPNNASRLRFDLSRVL